MEAEFWHERWRNNQIGFHQNCINPSLEAHWDALELDKGSHVLVPLCGKSRDMLWLMDQGYKVTGVEISEIAVDALFRDAGLRPEIDDLGGLKHWKHGSLSIITGDVFHLAASDISAVQGLYDRAALIAFPRETRSHYAGHILNLLSDDTRGILITLEYPAAEMEGPPFPVFEDEVRELFSGSYGVNLLERNDCLESNTKFRDRGLSQLMESVYCLG